MRPLLVLRPEPGASATAKAATTLGMHPIVAPLFTVHPRAWDPPDPGSADILLFTSANAPRHAGSDLARYRHLPARAVGRATAQAARDAGFPDVTAGTRDAAHLLVGIDPSARILHFCGKHVRPTGRPMRQIPVYTARAADTLPAGVREAMTGGAVAMLHSPRAATLFAALASDTDRRAVDIVAISKAAANAAGLGWRSVSAAARPTDAAMLAIARDLCENDRP